MRNRIILTLGLYAALSAVLIVPAQAQTVAGRVVLEGWGEPVPDAVVLLLDERYEAVDSAIAVDDGSYVVPVPGPGSYSLQARFGEDYGPLSPTLSLTGRESVEDLVLEFPSSLFRAALQCFVNDIRAGTGVLAGVVYDPRTETPLPGARVALEWPGADGGRQSREVFASDAGRYVACAVPADVVMTARVNTLGTTSPAHTHIVVAEGALARHDLALDLGSVGARLRVVTDVARERPDGVSQLTGRLLDAESGQPVAGAMVRLSDRRGEVVTGTEGIFEFADLEAGTYAIEVQHLGYGQQSEALEVPGSSDVTVELRVAPRAIELGAVRVRARREAVPMRMAGATPSRTLAGPRLVEAQRRGNPLYIALYDIPGIRLNYYQRAEGAPAVVCIEATRGRPYGGGCDMMEIFLDGVAISNDHAEVLLSGGLQDFERIEYLPPGQAFRWGMRAAETGALFLWTARGPRSLDRR